MSKKVSLFWFKFSKGKGNFGDELNPYIFERLTDTPFQYIDIRLLNDNKVRAFIILISNLLRNQIGIREFTRYLIYNTIYKPKVFLAIGSVLQLCNYKKSVIWGSGIIATDMKVPQGHYLAVRGLETVNRVRSLGNVCSDIVGDPAILLPRIYKAASGKKYKIGIVPHYAHFDRIKSKFMQEGIIVINLLGNITDIIDAINQCELTVSTSLHGIIVSHSYGVSSVWAEFKESKLFGDGIKYYDYFSSVKLKPYDPLDIKDLELLNTEDIIKKLKSKYGGMLLPDTTQIQTIQNNLLNVFPFPLREGIKQENTNIGQP